MTTKWMRIAGRLVATLLVTALLALTSASARADSADVSSEAEARIARGLALRRERRDAEALVEFRQAYALQRSARALAQIALAEDAVGLWVEAEQRFEEVLAEHGDPWVEKRRAQLTGELRELRSHLANVELAIAPEKAEVWINGALGTPAAATGAFRVVSGRVLVEVKREGFVPERRVFEVPPGARVRDSIALVAAPPVQSEAPSPSAAPSARRVPTAPSARRILVFSSLAAAGSALLIGTAAAVERQQTDLTYNDSSRCNYGGVPRSVRCPSLVDDSNRFTTEMAVGYATAGVAAILSAVLALTTPRDLRIDVSRAGRDGAMLRVGREF